MNHRPRYTAPMPDDLRHQLRADQHPARSVPCGHCGAKAHAACVLRKTGRHLTQLHPQRIAEWARTTACCPECQAEPGIPCRTPEGFQLPAHAVHARRYQEAEDACA